MRFNIKPEKPDNTNTNPGSGHSLVARATELIAIYCFSRDINPSIFTIDQMNMQDLTNIIIGNRLVALSFAKIY